jgi:hypothetical protein
MLMAGSSCKKLEDFDNKNVNPNGSPDVLTSALLTNVEANVAFPAGTEAVGISNNLIAGYFCQYFAEPTYPGSSRYNQPKINYSATYSGMLQDLEVIMSRNSNPATAGTANVTSGGANGSQIAIAMILKSYIYWTLTDKWGDIPYSEATKGVANLHPKYDEQQKIYEGILADLTAANAKFDENGVGVKGDVIYNGDIAKWRKLSNSLRMLVSLRLSKRFPGAGEYAAQQFTAALNDPYLHITTNADNFTVLYPGGNYRNPWFATGGSSDNGVSKTYVDLLQGLNDSRLSQMASNSTGVPYGLEIAVPQGNNYAKILSANNRLENSPIVIINAASVLLAKAEAVKLGWMTGDAKSFYDAGVTASFQQWGVAVPAAYLTTGAANFTSGAGVAVLGTPGAGPAQSTTPGANALTPTELHRIALQQYIAFYPDGTQGWSQWRRSEYIGVMAAPPAGTPAGTDRGVPDIRPTTFNTNATGKIPRRFVYGTSDYSLNGDQVAIAAQRYEFGDDQDSRVWWDKKP